MLTITSQNQQNPTFKERQVVALGKKVSQKLMDRGIRPSTASFGGLMSTLATGGVSVAAPGLIAAPEAAKLGVTGALGLLTGIMSVITRKKEKAESKYADQQALIPKKPISPLLTLGLGSLFGGGILAGMSPIVWHNAKIIAEQRVEIQEQRAILKENKKVLELVANNNTSMKDRVYKIEINDAPYHIRIDGNTAYLTKKGMKQYKDISECLAYNLKCMNKGPMFDVESACECDDRIRLGNYKYFKSHAEQYYINAAKLEVLLELGEIPSKKGRYDISVNGRTVSLTKKGLKQFWEAKGEIAAMNVIIEKLQTSKAYNRLIKMDACKETLDKYANQIKLIIAYGEMP